jgi:hypothetical protein
MKPRRNEILTSIYASHQTSATISKTTTAKTDDKSRKHKDKEHNTIDYDRLREPRSIKSINQENDRKTRIRNRTEQTTTVKSRIRKKHDAIDYDTTRQTTTVKTRLCYATTIEVKPPDKRNKDKEQDRLRYDKEYNTPCHILGFHPPAPRLVPGVSFSSLVVSDKNVFSRCLGSRYYTIIRAIRYDSIRFNTQDYDSKTIRRHTIRQAIQ